MNTVTEIGKPTRELSRVTLHRKVPKVNGRAVMMKDALSAEETTLLTKAKDVLPFPELLLFSTPNSRPTRPITSSVGGTKFPPASRMERLMRIPASTFTGMEALLSNCTEDVVALGGPKAVDNIVTTAFRGIEEKTGELGRSDTDTLRTAASSAVDREEASSVVESARQHSIAKFADRFIPGGTKLPLLNTGYDSLIGNEVTDPTGTT